MNEDVVHTIRQAVNIQWLEKLRRQKMSHCCTLNLQFSSSEVGFFTRCPGPPERTLIEPRVRQKQWEIESKEKDKKEDR